MSSSRAADKPIEVVMWPRGRDWYRRFVPMMLGLAILGLAVAVSVRADVGLAPWDVLHQGLQDLTGLAFGTVVIIVGLVTFVFWIPLREKPGLGTVCNMIFVGLFIDAFLEVIPKPEPLAIRIPMLIASLLLFGIAIGLYVGAGLGAGSRDGLMTGLAARGLPVWAVRTGVELTVLVIGVALGGTVGIGTVVLALGVGPCTHVALHLFRLREPAEEPTGIGMTGE